MIKYRVGIPESLWSNFREIEKDSIGEVKLVGGSSRGLAGFTMFYDIEVPDDETYFYLKLKYGMIDGVEDVKKLAATKGICND